MTFIDKIIQTSSFMGASIFGYLSGCLYLWLGLDAILNPTYNSIAASSFIIAFAMILINIPFILISFIAIIIEYISRLKNGLFKDARISLIKNILLIIGFILLFIPIPIFFIIL